MRSYSPVPQPRFSIDRRRDRSSGPRAGGATAALFSFALILPALILLALSVGGVATAPAAMAQSDPSLQAIVAKLNRLEADLNSLQRNFYRGEQMPAASAVPSAPSSSADSGDPFFAFEQSLRRLTAQVEENGHRVQQMERQVSRLAEDVEFRLQEIEGKLGLSALGDGAARPAQPAPAAAPAPSGTARDVPTARPSGSDPEPQQLGTLRMDPGSGSPRADGASRPGSATAALTAVPGDAFSGSARERYNASLQLIRVGQLSEAEAALQAFLRDYPDDSLASNAQYWLGETFYARNEYEQAAAAFLAGFRNHPEDSKAPDNLLKLGISLSAMGQRAESCPVFDTLLNDYPNAPSMIRDRARAEKSRSGC